MKFVDLPNDALIMIGLDLHIFDIMNLCKTNKEMMKKLYYNEKFWKLMAVKKLNVDVNTLPEKVDIKWYIDNIKMIYEYEDGELSLKIRRGIGFWDKELVLQQCNRDLFLNHERSLYCLYKNEDPIKVTTNVQGISSSLSYCLVLKKNKLYKLVDNDYLVQTVISKKISYVNVDINSDYTCITTKGKLSFVTDLCSYRIAKNVKQSTSGINNRFFNVYWIDVNLNLYRSRCQIKIVNKGKKTGNKPGKTFRKNTEHLLTNVLKVEATDEGIYVLTLKKKVKKYDASFKSGKTIMTNVYDMKRYGDNMFFLVI